MAVYIVPYLNRAAETFITNWQNNAFGHISEDVGEIFARNAPDTVLTPKIGGDFFGAFFGPRVVRLRHGLKKIGSDILWDAGNESPARLDQLEIFKTNWPAEKLRPGQIAIKIPGIAQVSEWPEGVTEDAWSNVWRLCESHALPGNKYRGGLWGAFTSVLVQALEIPDRPAPAAKPAAPTPGPQPDRQA